MDGKPMNKLAPWQDRWSKPSVKQLLSSLNAQHRKAFEQMLHSIDEMDGARCEVTWYGPAWKWTIHITDDHQTPSTPPTQPASPDASTLCYLVPALETPMICVPLEKGVIDRLPLPRLSKFIRDGVNAAKHAVAIHWATWNASTAGEAVQLVDLIQRRRSVHVGEPQPVLAKPKRKR